MLDPLVPSFRFFSYIAPPSISGAASPSCSCPIRQWSASTPSSPRQESSVFDPYPRVLSFEALSITRLRVARSIYDPEGHASHSSLTSPQHLVNLQLSVTITTSVDNHLCASVPLCGIGSGMHPFLCTMASSYPPTPVPLSQKSYEFPYFITQEIIETIVAVGMLFAVSFVAYRNHRRRRGSDADKDPTPELGVPGDRTTRPITRSDSSTGGAMGGRSTDDDASTQTPSANSNITSSNSQNRSLAPRTRIAAGISTVGKIINIIVTIILIIVKITSIVGRFIFQLL